MSVPNQTSKPLSERDFQQTLRGSFNNVDKSFTTNGWLSAQVGNKITFLTFTTTVSGDSQRISFYDQETILLYQLSLVFTDGTQSTLLSAERTA
jgi:hypothetical protein